MFCNTSSHPPHLIFYIHNLRCFFAITNLNILNHLASLRPTKQQSSFPFATYHHSQTTFPKPARKKKNEKNAVQKQRVAKQPKKPCRTSAGFNSTPPAGFVSILPAGFDPRRRLSTRIEAHCRSAVFFVFCFATDTIHDTFRHYHIHYGHTLFSALIEGWEG